MGGKVGRIEGDNTVAIMMEMLAQIAPLPRLINSPGVDEALAICQRRLPGLTIHEFPSGDEAEGWVVPPSWSISKGVMKDEHGRNIASIDQSHLFVAPYSEPVCGWFTKDEIGKHLRTRPDRPHAFALEHRNAYDYRCVDWGVTLPHALWEDLPQGNYFIEIEIVTSPTPMKVGEYILPGEFPDTICICAHVDELCNDDLTGCLVGIELMRHLERTENRRFSWQLLLVPELFGSLFFVHSNPDRVALTKGMLNLETLGAGEKWVLKRPLAPNTLIESALRLALKTREQKYEEIGFFEGYGNDEKVYSWPTMGIPGVALARYPFDQYHTSDDNPSIIEPELLLESLEIAKAFSRVIETNYCPRFTLRLPPWLTRHGLYFDFEDDPSTFRALSYLLYNVTGQKSLVELAELVGVDYFRAADYLQGFVDKGLVEKTPFRFP